MRTTDNILLERVPRRFFCLIKPFVDAWNWYTTMRRFFLTNPPPPRLSILRSSVAWFSPENEKLRETHTRLARRETSGGRCVYERGLRPRFPPLSFHGWPRRRTTDERACAAGQNVINTRTVLVFSGHTRVPHSQSFASAYTHTHTHMRTRTRARTGRKESR